MKFGTNTKDPKAAGGGGSGKFIKGFKKGELKLRFLQEMDPDADEFGGWTVYWEHFDMGKQRSFPCTGDRQTCPGCTSDNERTARASKKYLVNAVRPDEGYVDLYKIPVSAIDDLIRFADKDGNSITKRDYTVIRFEDSAGKTKYSVDKEDKYPYEVEPLRDKMQDHQTALAAQWLEAFGELPDDSGDYVQDLKPETVKKAPEVKTQDLPADEPVKARTVQDDDAFESVTGIKGDPPSEPAAAEADSDQGDEADEDDTVEMSEDELRNMEPSQVKDLFVQCGLEVPDLDDTDALVNELMEKLGS